MSTIKHKGVYKIIQGENETSIENKITKTAIDNIALVLSGTPNMNIKYLAIGTGTAIPDKTQTKLLNEVGRVPVLNISNANGKVVSNFVITSSEFDGIGISEIGIFCGSEATSAKNSGKMLSRVLASFTKVSNANITIERTDEFITEE